MPDELTEKQKYAARPIIKNISFFGDANIPETDPIYQTAYAVAKVLAEAGYTVVDGGGPGVMAAATKGAEAGGGDTVTVTFDPEEAPGFEGRYLGNIPDEEIVTTNYVQRMFKLIEHGDMFIIFKGGAGTISEFGTAWVLAKLYFGHHKPFILFGNHWLPVIDAIRRGMNVDAQEMSVFEIVDRVENVLPTIERFEKRMQGYTRAENGGSQSKDKAFKI